MGGGGGMGGGGMPAGFAPRGFARGAAGAPAGGMPGAAAPGAKAAPIEIPLKCTLEELFTGATKTRKLTRRVAEPAGVPGAGCRTREVEELLTIKLKPGWKAGTRITFEAKGDATVPGQVPADIVFVVAEKPHPVYRREGADLHAALPVTLEQALGAKRLAATVAGLDGKPVRVEAPAPLVAASGVAGAAGAVVRVRGEGMPLSKEPGKRGDLVATWDVRLPAALSDAARAAALAALAGASYDLSRPAPPPGA
jgi:DnaJ family protein B protein 4